MPTKKTGGRKRRNAPVAIQQSEPGRLAEQDEEQPVALNEGTANADAVTNIASGAETPPPHRYTLNQAVMYQEVNRARDIFPLTPNPSVQCPKRYVPLERVRQRVHQDATNRKTSSKSLARRL